MKDHPHLNLPPQEGGRLPGTIARARSLRKNMTRAEVKLWSHLRMRQLHNWRFRRQAPVGPYIADFLCHGPALIVEVDGGQHGLRRDEKRDAFFRAQGFLVLHFWNNDVLLNMEGVLTLIAEAGHRLKSPPPPAGEDLGGGNS
jgi:very-short-patch-repair endonuclease